MKYHPHVLIMRAEDIDSGDRVRKDLGEIKKMAASLEVLGQINPITIENGQLRTGGRRYFACLLLQSQGKSIQGLEPGEIMVLDQADKDLTDFERLFIEYEENKQRKGFTNAEEAIAISRLKIEMEKEQGKKISNRQLSKLLDFSLGQVTMALRVADAVENKGMADLKDSASIQGAYRKLQTREALQKMMARAEAREAENGVTEDYRSILAQGDALQWLGMREDESIDFFHVDPPWGIGIDDYDRHANYGTFDDDSETGITLAKAMIPELYRVLAEDAYLWIWFGIQYYQFLFDLLGQSGFKVHPVPFVWYKDNKKGAVNDPDRFTINSWEPAFLAEKGSPRKFTSGRQNVLTYPMPAGRIHYAQKNVDLLVDILERFSFGKMTVADPTFGSGSIFHACKRLGRGFTGCEKDPENYQNALAWLKRGEK